MRRGGGLVLFPSLSSELDLALRSSLVCSPLVVASLCSTNAVLGSAASIGSLTSAVLELASFLLVTLSTLYQFIITILIICYNITQ